MKKILRSILDKFTNDKTLYYLFIFVNLIPSLFLFLTEPFNVVGRMALITIPLAFLLIILSLSKRVAQIQLYCLPLFFFHAFQLVVFSLFKEDVLAVDMFLNLVTTNASEAGELLGSILLPTLITCFIYIIIIIAVIYSYRKKHYYSKKFLRNNRYVGYGLALISVPLFLGGKDINNQAYSFKNSIYPTNVFYNMGFAINKYIKVKNYLVTSQSFTYGATKSDNKQTNSPEVHILIIGETSRAENWSIYGYERETNPNLSKDSRVIRFKDTMTQSNTTHKSVSIILSEASAENYEDIYVQKSIISAFNEAGFTTVYLSNQAKNGSFIEYFSQEADYIEYHRSSGNLNNNFDDILLDRLKFYIDAATDNLFIVMHTYGSHFFYGERYPREFAKYTPDNFVTIDKHNRQRMVNAYDNSILYTDNFLNEVGKILTNSHRCASYLFISDHGEDIMDDDRGRFLHASPNPTYYQLRIPLLLWFSDTYKESYPSKVDNAWNNQDLPISSNMVFHTLVDIADISTKYLNKNISIVNKSFTPQARMYLGDHDNPIPYYQTNLKKEDKEMIDKNGLSIK